VAELDLDGAPLCVLTVHAHPDDEASKGAPTLAATTPRACAPCSCAAPAARRVTSRNPLLREPGQPFHDMTPEEERRS
jgi:mycothiol S-conjugate amidase